MVRGRAGTVQRRLTISVLGAVLGAAVVAAPAAEHRLSRSKAKRAIKRFVRGVARDVDGALTDAGDLLLVDESPVANSSLAVGDGAHGGDVFVAEPTPPRPPESVSRAVRVHAAVDYIAQSDSDDLDDLLFDSLRKCWPNWSHGQ
jgi:hypothetical protein